MDAGVGRQIVTRIVNCAVWLGVTTLLSAAVYADGELVWTVGFADGIEWGRRVGPELSPALLIVTPGGAVHILDGATGARRLNEPIAMAPGVQFVRQATGAASDAWAFVFDRYAVCAVELGPLCGRRWTYGDAPTNRDVFPGDPEVLAGWQAGITTRRGVVMVDRSGAIVYLDRARGTLIARCASPPAALVQMHAREDRVAMLRRSAGRTQVIFARIGRRMTMRSGEDQADWPLWSGIVGDGLVAVSRERLVYWAELAPPARVMKTPTPWQAARIAAYESRNGAASRPTVAALVLGMGTDDAVQALDLSAGRVHWRSRPVNGDSVQVDAIRTVGRRFIVRSPNRVCVGDVRDGRIEDVVRLRGSRCLDAHVANERVYMLVRDESSRGTSMLMVKYARLGAGDGVTDAECRIALSDDDAVRSILWGEQHVFVVLAQSVHAVTLP